MDTNARSMNQIKSAERDQRALGLPDLEGNSLTTLAPLARQNIIRDARIYFFCVANPAMTADEFETRFLTPARRIVSAEWWVEQCDAHPEALLADLESKTA